MPRDQRYRNQVLNALLCKQQRAAYALDAEGAVSGGMGGADMVWQAGREGYSGGAAGGFGGSNGAAIGAIGPGEAAADDGAAPEAAGRRVEPRIIRPRRTPEEVKVAARALLEDIFVAAEEAGGSDAGKFGLSAPLMIKYSNKLTKKKNSFIRSKLRNHSRRAHGAPIR